MWLSVILNRYRKEKKANDGSLASLKKGQRAFISGIHESCEGLERRRLLDLGFVPGSEIEMVMSGAFNGPKAYRVKGSVIALRDDQASKIQLLSA